MTIKNQLKNLAQTYAKKLSKQIDTRIEEMKLDDQSHFLIYQVLGVTIEEGKKIDIYQNKGRFLYKYAGFKPVRIMFYYPNRQQAKKIQETLETLYKGIGGEYYWGDQAWEYVKNRTEIDLKLLLENIAQENQEK